MSMDASRKESRESARRLELVTVCRDRVDLPYEQALDELSSLASTYTIFSVVGVVRDISQSGLGIRFEGQQLMANNLLQPHEHYILKLTIFAEELEASLKPFFRREGGSYHYFLLKGECCWYNPIPGALSSAGFALTGSNPPELVEFFCERFNLRIPE